MYAPWLFKRRYQARLERPPPPRPSSPPQEPQDPSRIYFWLGVTATAALVPAFWFLNMPSRWGPTLPLVILAVLTTLATLLAASAYNEKGALGPEFTYALVMLVFFGPLPTITIWIGTEAMTWFVRHHKVTLLLANMASFGWATLLGAVTMIAFLPNTLGPPEGVFSYLVLVALGLLIGTTNYVISTLLSGVLANCRGFMPLARREFLQTLPVGALMVGIAVAAIFLYARIGVAALSLLAISGLVPRLYIPRFVRRVDPDHIDSASLEEIALEMAATMGYRKRDRDLIKAALPRLMATKLHIAGSSRKDRSHEMARRLLTRYVMRQAQEQPNAPPDHSELTELMEALDIVICSGERYDGRGKLGYAAEEIPATSRLLAVVDAFWTAVDQEEIDPEVALERIKESSGKVFDPVIVNILDDICSEPQFGLSSKHLERLSTRLPLPQF